MKCIIKNVWFSVGAVLFLAAFSYLPPSRGSRLGSHIFYVTFLGVSRWQHLSYTVEKGKSGSLSISDNGIQHITVLHTAKTTILLPSSLSLALSILEGVRGSWPPPLSIHIYFLFSPSTQLLLLLQPNSMVYLYCLCM